VGLLGMNYFDSVAIGKIQKVHENNFFFVGIAKKSNWDLEASV